MTNLIEDFEDFEDEIAEKQKRSSKKTRDSNRISKNSDMGRKPLDFSSGSRFNVPEEIIEGDPDHVYSFVVKEEETLNDAINVGWSPVKMEEHPSFQRQYLLLNENSNKELASLVSKGGQVLMKIPKEKFCKNLNKYEMQHKNQIDQIKTNSQYQDILQNVTTSKVSYGAGGVISHRESFRD